ncbi:MAG: 6-phospho-3-hexuloisomerase [Treponema sp.]|jgi:6-phospho-3-hexuloisomerase|nr:6-phospho-3-hexuloisomerase [Treponema sp.]
MDYKTEYQQMTKAVIEEHRQVFEKLDMGELGVFVEAVAGAKRVFVMGGGREGISCRGFAMRLAHLGKEAHWIWDDTAVAMGPGDLFVVSEGSGDVGMFGYVLEKAKQSGARIAIITGMPDGAQVKKYADIVLFVHSTVYLGKAGEAPGKPKQHDVVPTRQPMGNQYEQHLYMLLDVIVIFVMKEMGQSYQEMENRHRNIE